MKVQIVISTLAVIICFNVCIIIVELTRELTSYYCLTDKHSTSLILNSFHCKYVHLKFSES